MPTASIVITAEDSYSATLKTLSTTTKAFSKDVSYLEDRLFKLSRNKAVLQINVSKAKKELTELAKKFAETGDDLDGLKLEMAQAQYDGFVRNLNAVKSAAHDTEKELSKLENRAGSGGGGGGGISQSVSKLTHTIAANGITKMIGDLAQSIGLSTIQSKYGADAGIIASSVLSSAGTGLSAGAAIGSMVAPVIGTAIGGAIGTFAGGIIGFFGGQEKIFEKKDDAFKDYVQSAVEEQDTLMDQRLTSGKTIAGGREQTRIAFGRMLGGGEAAADYLAQVERFATKTNYSYDEITGYTKQLMNTYNPEEIFGVLETLSDASAGLDLESSDVSSLINVLNTMRLTGRITSQQMNQFAVRGINIYDALAQGMGVSTDKVKSMVSKGKISGNDAAQAVLNYIQNNFGGLSDTLAQTYDAMVDNLADAQASTEAVMGKAYNEKRKEGIQTETDWLEGFGGDELKEGFAVIGEWRAELDNQKDAMRREAIQTVLNSAEYWEAIANKDGATVERLLKEAGVKGLNEYNASDLAQEQVAAQLELVERVRSDARMNDAYWDAGYRLGQEFTKGMKAANLEYWNKHVDDLPGGYEDIEPNSDGWADFGLPAMTTGIMGHAAGLTYVPYDNFPALLHQGERVLTAEQARAMEGTVSVQISGNTFVIREDADVDRVAAALLEKLQLAANRG